MVGVAAVAVPALPLRPSGVGDGHPNRSRSSRLMSTSSGHEQAERHHAAPLTQLISPRPTACLPLLPTRFPPPQVQLKYRMSKAPKLVEIIAALPEEHKATLLPQ